MKQVPSRLLCDKVKFVRKYNNFTQKQIAEILDVEKSTYSYFETATHYEPQLLQDIANFFKINVHCFLDNSYTLEQFKTLVTKYVPMKSEKSKSCTFCKTASTNTVIYFKARFTCISCLDELVKLSKKQELKDK